MYQRYRNRKKIVKVSKPTTTRFSITFDVAFKKGDKEHVKNELLCLLMTQGKHTIEGLDGVSTLTPNNFSVSMSKVSK